MNALLIAGLVGFAIWFERRRSTKRRVPRPSDDALSHALRAPDFPLR